MNFTEEHIKGNGHSLGHAQASRGVDSDPGPGVGRREHFVQFYEKDESLVDSVAMFVGAGLGAGEGAIVIATPLHRDALEKQLRAQGVDLDVVRSSGQYLALDAAETLSQVMVDGSLDERRFKAVLGTLVTKIGKGRRDLRAFGEMVALLWEAGNSAAALRVEELWNELGQVHSFKLFCAYPIAGFSHSEDGAPFKQICHLHSGVLPSEAYLARGEDDRLREIAALQQKALALEQEIARREQSEQKLRQREAELTAFIENASVGLHWVGPDGRIQWANRADFELLGYTADEYVGHDIAEFHADRAVVEDILERLTRGERLHDYEARLKCKDGSLRTVLIDSCVLSQGERFVHTQCFTRDITQRKRAEEALRKSEARYRQVVSLMPAGVYACDADGRITFFNRRAAELWGREPELNRREIFCPCHKVFLPDGTLLPPHETPMAVAVREGKTFRNTEAMVVRPDGSRLMTALNIDPIRDEAGHICGAINVFQDISEQKEAEVKLHASKVQIEAELADTQLLQEISATLIQEDKIDILYEKILDAAVSIMRSDMASMQTVDEKADGLRMLAWRGFEPEFGEIFKLNRSDARTSCSLARRMGERVIIPDIETCEFIVGTPALEAHRQTGIRAVQSTPLFSRGGTLVGMISTHWRQPHQPSQRDLRLLDILARQAADLLERRQAESALRESEVRFRTVVDNSTAVIYMKDCEGRYLLINKQYAKLFHTHTETFIGKTDFDLFPPEIAQQFRDNDLAVIHRGEPVESEEVAPHDDGPHTYLSIKFPLRKTDHSIYGVAGISTDITDRKRAAVSMSRLAAIVESSDDAIISKDLNGVITSWNQGATRLFGYVPEEVIGKPVTILMPADRVDEEPGILASVRRGERIHHYETVRRRKDGTLLNISLTVSPVKDANGTVVGASKVARDITDKVRARQELERIVAERTAQLRDTVAELEAFSYSVAHDMRAPLRAMTSYSQFLVHDFAPILPPQGQEFAQRIVAGALRLDALITDVLNYSKIARGEMALEKVDVEKLTREIVDSYVHLQESGAVILVQSGIPPVRANSAALTQCISNLLSNAIKFVAPGTTPRVLIRAEKKADSVRLWFEDNGIGISEEGRKRIFRMFQRLNPAQDFEGTGIGLTIVRKAVQRMGGQIGVESQPGVGSQFWIELKRVA